MAWTLEQLRSFVAAAEHGSFSAAARAGGRAQSVVSAHIALLEADLGVDLFRRGHMPTLTEAGALLLLAMSVEILTGDHRHFSQAYLWIQFAVCIVFLADFFIRLARSERRTRFFLRNLLFLLLSIPYLNLVDWFSLELARGWAMLIGLTPLLRGFLALYIIVAWLARNRFNQLLAAYLFSVLVFTYLASLVFYDYEILVNPRLAHYGDALWWAWINVTTVGAAIFPVTAVGKVVCVLLPIVGMIFFPIFTVYISQYYTGKKSSN